MPKLKTHKATSKRFWLTGKGKLRRRQSGQNHFNARANEKVTKNKRKDEDVTATNRGLRTLIPYK